MAGGRRGGVCSKAGVCEGYCNLFPKTRAIVICSRKRASRRDVACHAVAAVSSHDVFAFAAIIRSHCVVASFSFFLATFNPAYKCNEGISFSSRHN